MVTYKRGFFLGPGLPRGFGMPSFEPLAAGADRLTPFFFSAGGAMDDGPGVPSCAGVAALESEAVSPLFGVASRMPDVDGDASGLLSGEGVSFLATVEPMSSRRRSGATVKLTNRVGLPPDFRRASLGLAVGAMATGSKRRCPGYGDEVCGEDRNESDAAATKMGVTLVIVSKSWSTADNQLQDT